MKYNVYRNWGTELHLSTDNEQEAWDSLLELNFGEGFMVKDEHGKIHEQFVPF